MSQASQLFRRFIIAAEQYHATNERMPEYFRLFRSQKALNYQIHNIKKTLQKNIDLGESDS